MKNSIYLFSAPANFLQSARDQYGDFKKPVSLALWARKLGYQSSRSLELIISGSWFPSEELFFKISKDLKIPEKERTYSRLTVQKEKNFGIKNQCTKLKKRCQR